MRPPIPSAHLVVSQHPGGTVSPDAPAPRAAEPDPGEGAQLTPSGYALALALSAGLPLASRAGLLAFLAPFEPHPAAYRDAVIQAHLSGLLRHHTLTPAGLQAARHALEGAALPPRSIPGPDQAERRNA